MHEAASCTGSGEIHQERSLDTVMDTFEYSDPTGLTMTCEDTHRLCSVGPFVEPGANWHESGS